MSYVSYNANPRRNNVGDCTVRAISKALGQDWETTYTGVSLQGYMMCDMPSANAVWGSYLRRKGFTRNVLPNTCPDCYTVREFCQDHSAGVYVLALQSHVIAVIDGDYYDTWDSGDEVPLYYWERNGE